MGITQRSMCPPPAGSQGPPRRPRKGAPGTDPATCLFPLPSSCQTGSVARCTRPPREPAPRSLGSVLLPLHCLSLPALGRGLHHAAHLSQGSWVKLHVTSVHRRDGTTLPVACMGSQEANWGPLSYFWGPRVGPPSNLPLVPSAQPRA